MRKILLAMKHTEWSGEQSSIHWLPLDVLDPNVEYVGAVGLSAQMLWRRAIREDIIDKISIDIFSGHLRKVQHFLQYSMFFLSI